MIATPSALYRPSLALLTDLYQLTMAYGQWKLGRLGHEATFHLTFRRHPFAGGYSIAAGLGDAIDYLRHLRFTAEDLAYLGTLTGNDQRPLFERAFLDFLADYRLTCDVDAIPEGTAVFPHEPLVRVRGPILDGHLLETPLLAIINFQTLIATKAARVCEAARGEPVLEFGLRRAQGIDGALSAARAAYLGGAAATSNVLAGKLYGIPVKGTHAHSWVMAFGDEVEAFEAYAQVMPNNCIFLVDTYDTLEGVRHAAAVGRRLRERGHKMTGIRLDSGDLAYLSIEARKILDDAGLHDAAIVASNEIDESVIESLKTQGAAITVWGVGTRLVTGHPDAALGGVYKLAATREPGGAWTPRVKLSEQAVKVSNPGVLQVRRFRREGQFIGDMIYDELAGAGADATIVDPADPTRRKTMLPATEPGAPPPDPEDLLVPVMRGGRVVYDVPPLEASRRRVREQLDALHPTIRRILNPHEYPAGLSEDVHELKMRLIREARHE